MNAKITQEIRLIAASGLKAPSGHEEEYDWAVDFVAPSDVYRGLVLRRMEGSLGIELNVAFQLGSEIVAEHEAGKPSIGALVDQLITDLVIDVDRSKFS